MINSRETINAFAKEANEFLIKRGYADNAYFIGGNILDFYPENFYYDFKNGKIKKIHHPNGKKFKPEIANKINYRKYQKFICELLEPIMKKYNISIDDIR